MKCRKVVIRVIVLQNNVPFDLFKLQLKLYSAVYFSIILHRNIKYLGILVYEYLFILVLTCQSGI